MDHKFQATGLTDKAGQLKITNNKELMEFCRLNPNMRAVVTVEVFDRQCSKAQIGYIRNYILPTVQRKLNDLGDRKTINEVEEFVKSISPITSQSDTELEDLSMKCISIFIEDIVRFCSMELDYILETP